TAYGGGQTSSHYQSVAAGMGKNMGDLGAVSVDVIQAWSTPQNLPSDSGQSWRARYSKNFVETGTNFAIAGYRYSTKGFYGMQEVLDSYGDNGVMQNRRRNRMELTMNQSLGGSLGSIMVSAVREDYWNSGRAMESWSLGYNNFWNGISYGLTYTSTRNGTPGTYGNPTSYDKDRMVAFNISVPLDKFLPQTWANYSVSNSKNSGTTHTIGINGTALDNNALNWNVQQGYGSDNVGYSGNVNGDYKGTYGEVTAGYSYDQNNERLNYGIQGGVIAHADGVTLSQPLGETNVLVKVPGAKGLTVRNQTGAKTDYRGYTTVNNVNVYRKNDIVIDPESMSDDVELDLTTRTVVPTRGAVVRAEYTANVGQRALFTLLRGNGKPVPFGAIVSVNGIKNSGFIVGDNGQVYLTGLGENIDLIAQWGEGSDKQCKASYILKPTDVKNNIAVVSTVCR
ncbi:fimbria/pilus outer membrane usher protein, partial [Enterobacter quasiroggenkampii]|uniref:fimbria/pilus outer membrane usher protein n=1 Tax=Enterobacter quasiroggenkampii TaxID=2497436 RepID=UPI0021CFB6DB